MLKEHVRNTELGYFVQDLLPLAAKMRAKSKRTRRAWETPAVHNHSKCYRVLTVTLMFPFQGQQYQSQAVVANVYDTLQAQVWISASCCSIIQLN